MRPNSLLSLAFISLSNHSILSVAHTFYNCHLEITIACIFIYSFYVDMMVLTLLRQKAVMESCSLWMILTGSGSWASGWPTRSVTSMMLGGLRRLPNTQRMNSSCTGSWRTRKLHSRRAGAADQWRGLEHVNDGITYTVSSPCEGRDELKVLINTTNSVIFGVGM